MTVIKNIIFDFGGVIYDIDFNRARNAFAEIGVANFDELYSQANQNHLFEKLEKDLISPDEFRSEIRNITSKALSDIEIDAAWNALLVGFCNERLELLQSIRNNYKIFLFSNTNRIHYAHFLKQFQNLTNFKSFDGLFVKSFFSFDIKRRKPDVDAYFYIIENMKLIPEETLFIDDSLQNIRPAGEIGIKCWHLTDEVTTLFSNNKLKQEIIDQLSWDL
ncbi:MAG: HAD family phosphatase [Bacteroidetes bacterium HGW-Bacteroidetes-17]|jgi:putative hydrolase of the HAD superfamily|nr:MAG: HAD family phosphatase [Bacteroidetes bacterium HGW-Bacteroidetes-17]